MSAVAAALAKPYPGPTSTDRLRSVGAELAATRERIETAFVDVGNHLSQSATLLNAITSVFEALPRDLDSAELTEATERLAAVGHRAGEISSSFATEQQDIARLVAVVTGADHPISDLRKAVKMMGIVAINARVVAAGVATDTDDFAVFTTDIAELSASAAKTIHDFSAVYARLTEDVRRVAEQRALFEASHRDTLTKLVSQLEASLGEVTASRRASAEGSSETGRVSRQIAGRIASAVMAMQVGDATRQRIEHIEGAFAALIDLTEHPGDDGHTLDADDLPSAIADIARLQQAQLRGTTETYDSEVAEADRALQELAADAGTVLAHSQDVYGKSGAEGQSSLTTLSREVRHAVAVLRDCETERHKLEQVAAAVQATVKVLLAHVEAVQDIEATMRLVSLNAAVKCAQLGPRGRALNVIARQLRELTGETVVAAEAAMTSLGEAASLAQSFNASSTGAAAGQVAWLEQEATTALGLLETVDQRLREALAVLDRDGPAAIALLRGAAASMSGHAGISEAMSDLGFQITEMTDARAAIAPASRPLLRQLRRRYTMEAERRIHERVAGPDPEDEPAPAPQADAGLDDLLF